MLVVVLADANDNLEATGFTNGTGSTQPTGIITRLAATTASRGTSTTNGPFGGPDLFALVNSLPARHQASPAWLAHWGIYNQVRQFTTSAAPSAGNYWTDLGSGQPAELLGAPAYRASAMTSGLSSATASTDNVIILGDFPQLPDRRLARQHDPLRPDREGRVTSPDRRDQLARALGVGWVLFWRTGSDVTDANAFRMLQV